MKKEKVKVKTGSKKITQNKKALIVGVVLIAIVISILSSMGGVSRTVIHDDSSKNSENRKILNELSNPAYANLTALGKDNAKVIMVEFGDYQCQYCKRFHSNTKDSIITNFVNTGKLRFLFKDFTINDKPGDKASTLSAEASYCAADQGKYWQYHDEIYKNSKGENVAWVTKDMLKQFASNVNISDMKTFSSCLDSNRHADVIAGNNNLANNLGLQATPTFILLSTNDKPQQYPQQPIAIEGAQPYSVFEQIIEKIYSS